mgnify:CR=1 FL=1
MSDQDQDDESISKQILNIIFENKLITTFASGWVIFNVIILVLLIYISVKISLK